MDGAGIRATVVDRLNANSEYRQLFADIFSDVQDGGPITYEMLARAIAEFEFGAKIQSGSGRR